MNNGLNLNDPTVVAAFRAALGHQLIVVLIILAVLSVIWVGVRDRAPGELRPAAPAEPSWRLLLRVGFGLLWLLDGVLQAQPRMAVGLPSQVIEPIAANSPAWVQHLVNWAGTSWSYHPIQAAASVVWIQAGIGLWLLVAIRGPLSRLAGVASVAWGLVVWAFGESFGGIFAPGLTWLTGAPGAALVYCVAGALIALPERSWRTPRPGRWVLGGMGIFLAGMAVLQAWPGRGFWQGTIHGQPGTLTGMVQQMSAVSQPGFLARVVSGFGSLVAAHGFAVNLVAVIALAAAGTAFTAAAVVPGAASRLIRPAVIAFTVLCLADWMLIEDFGFFGGLGTDPNSMIPMALLAIAGYLALTPVPAPVVAASQPQDQHDQADEAESPGFAPDWHAWLRPSVLRGALARASLGSVLSVAAIAVMGLGAIPMATAQASPNASTILAQAIDGPSMPVDFPAYGFTLTDQHGRQVSLASLRGRVVLLSFLDPVCVTDCPLEAQEMKQAGEQLGTQARQVVLLAVNLNPDYNSVAYVRAFDSQEGLDGVPDWLFLTGSPAQLKKIYAQYGVVSQTLPGGSMLGHSDIALVIDRRGWIRQEVDFDPGPGTAATQSSFATEMASAASQALKSS